MPRTLLLLSLLIVLTHAAAAVAQGASQTQPADATAQTQSADEALEALQGEWVLVWSDKEGEGEPRKRMSVEEADLYLRFEGNRVTETERHGRDRDAVESVTTVVITPKQDPAWIDIKKEAQRSGGARETLAIYELRGEGSEQELVIAFGPGGERPRSFDHGEDDTVRSLVIFRRPLKESSRDDAAAAVADEAPQTQPGDDSAQTQSADEALKGLQGYWDVKYAVVAGDVFPKEELQKAHLQIRFKGEKGLVIDKDEGGFPFTIRMGEINKETNVREVVIDIPEDWDRGGKKPGILKVDGDKLFLAWNEQQNGPRPTEFTHVHEEDQVFLAKRAAGSNGGDGTPPVDVFD